MQGGLNGRPGVSNSCRWVVRVVVEEFDELLGVASRLPVDSRMNGTRLMRGYLSNSFFSSRLAT